MLDRRTFLASVAAMALFRPGAAGAVGTEPDEAFLNRLTFGATVTERDALARLGRAAWLEDQLARPARDPVIDGLLGRQTLRMAYEAAGETDDGDWPAVDELRPMTALYADPATLLPLVNWDVAIAWPERVRPAEEVILAALTRAVHAPAQVREVMTQFWHDHFNVHAHKDEFVAIFFPSFDAALRENALGNFRTLLGAVAKSPAMLNYLNNADSRASPANENFARELLELHTLGAPNYLNHLYARWDEVPKGPDGVAQGYIDQDVYEVARAFTGWSIGDGRWISEGVEAPMTGLFHYVEAWHDPYQKRILGVEFDPNRGPMADGEQVLDMLARHPGTAHFVCTKIARRLLADDPDPALVERLTAVFLGATEAPDQIALVVRALALDPAFDAPPAKIRRPFEFLAALYRASGAKMTGTETSYHWQLSRAGWLQHTFPPPTGHPDRLEDWQSGTVLLRFVDLAIAAHDDWFGCTTTRLSLTAPERGSLAELSRYWTTRCHGTPDDRLAELWAGVDADPSDAIPPDEGSRHDLSAMALAFAALTPQFMFR